MCGYIEYECYDCRYKEERSIRRVCADAFKVVGGELKTCPECSSKELIVRVRRRAHRRPIAIVTVTMKAS